jgi:vanillate O-demethylase monooxygenase subunit
MSAEISRAVRAAIVSCRLLDTYSDPIESLTTGAVWPGTATEETKMYPLDEGLLYPLQQWWVAAKSVEVGGELLGRTLLEEEVVLYRTQAGEAIALNGRCPHRLYPLVRGTRECDAVRCAYHGFAFGADGRCVDIPTQAHIPASMQVRRYPTREAYGWVWIWMGDPALAADTDLPQPECLAEGWEVVHGHYMHLDARYTLLIDNLFDLSHVAFLHASLLGTEGQRPPGFETPPELREVDGRFQAIRQVRNSPYDGYATLLFGPGQGPIDFDTPSDYHGPGLIVTGARHWLSDAGSGALAVELPDGRRGGSLRNVHAMTPETLHSTHYFSVHARNFRHGDEAFSAMYTEVDHQVRLQDKQALELIEPAARLARLRDEQSGLQDGGGIRVRRLLARQIRAEPQKS